MPRKLLCFGLVLLTLGCTREDWLARFHLIKAERSSSKGYALRVKPELSLERRKYYEAACKDFRKAYDYQAKVFTLNRIEMAMDACLRVEDRENFEHFLRFEEEYIDQHPRETEWGDAAPIAGFE